MDRSLKIRDNPGGCGIDGILNIWKPSGMTSFGVVDHVRKTVGIRKAGHGGTLDPLATGVLLVLLGEATKIQAYLPDEKEYEGIMKLGEETSTQDTSGNIIRQVKDLRTSEKEVKEISRTFLGRIKQVPPMASAKHYRGRRLYELHRQGKEVERKPHEVVITSLNILEYSPPLVRFSVVCSGGTYVRTLVHDWGKRLGCGAHLISLVRKRIGHFHLEDSLPLSSPGETYFSSVKPVEDGLSSLGKAVLKDWAAVRVFHGGNIDNSGVERWEPSPSLGNVFAVYSGEGTLLALARQDNGYWFPLRVFRWE